MSNFTWVCKIDWLTLTIKGGFGSSVKELDHDLAAALAYRAFESVGYQVDVPLERQMPSFGYAYAFTEPYNHVRIDVGANVEVQGLKMTLSGSVLDGIPARDELLRNALRGGWKPTRIDIALDALDTGVTISSIRDAYMSNVNRSVQRSTRYIEKGKAHTFELGSRTSEKFMRIYDKGAQQRTLASWLRFELECKGTYAVQVGSALMSETALCGVPTMLKMLHYPETKHELLDAIAEVITGVDYVSPESVKGSSDTLLWLEKSVKPSLVKLHKENRAEFRAFLATVFDGIEANEGIVAWDG